jgi:ketosteroid isomerase-like protein
LENRWAAATAAKDLPTIQGLLAGDYVGVTAGGNIVNKAGLLAELRRDKNTYDSVANARLDVRIHGSTAVIVGTTKQRGKDAAGKPFSYTYRWTDTWVERNGTWQCVASQSIRLPG